MKIAGYNLQHHVAKIAILAISIYSASLAWPQPATDYMAAAAYVRQGQPEAAIPLLNKILSAAPGDLKARNLLGIALMSSGHRAEANAQFQKVLRQDPRFHPALKNLAINEFDMGLKKESKLHFEQAVKLVPNDAVVHFHLGQIYFQEERYQAAANHFELAQNGFPDRYQAGFNLVLARVKGKEYASAILDGEKLIGQGFQKAELYNLLSRAYSQSGKTQQAYDALRTATKIDPRDETNYLDLMMLCLELQNWDLSLEISDVALQNIPNSYKVRLQRGAVFAMKGRLEDAETEFLAATKAAPTVGLPYVTLALARMEMGKLAEATQLLRERRALNSKDYFVNWILADALIRDGSTDEKEAADALEDALRVRPDAVQARKLLAELLVKRGDLARAAREFETVLKREPDDTSVAYQLATVYRKTGDVKRAEELFAKVGKARAEAPPPMAPATLVQIIREGAQ